MVYGFGDIRVDLRRGRVSKGGQPVKLEPKAYQLLVYFLKNRDRVIEKSELLDAVWGDAFVSENAMTRVIAQLRKALDDDPKESKVIETVSKRGYRFIAEVALLDDELQRGGWSWKRTAAFAGLLVSMPFVTLFWNTTTDEPEPIESLVVLPFESEDGSEDDEYLADGIAESLIHRFSRIPGLKVIARTTAFRFRDSKMDPLAVGRELGVEAVLLGKLAKTDEGLKLSVELVEVETGFQFWGETYGRNEMDIMSAQRQIAGEVLGALRLSGGGQPWSELGTDSVHAYHAYLRGRYVLKKGSRRDFKKAIELFEESRTLDPDYAPALAGLADSYFVLATGNYGRDPDYPPQDTFERAREAALEALHLDDGLVEARTTLAFVRAIYDWDWDAAETDFQEALALNPGYVTAHKYYSAYLTTLGRHDEAIREAERAVELDPKSPSLNHNLGMVLYFARDFERAAEVFEDVVDLEPKRRAARAWLAGANWYSGQREKAIAMVKEFDPVAEGIMSRLNEGNIEEARVFFDSIEHRLRPGIRKALWLAWVERWDDVLEYLEETVDDRQPPFVLMAFPGLDPLRDHPRYVALCQRMGLDAQSLARPSGRGLKAP